MWLQHAVEMKKNNNGKFDELYLVLFIVIVAIVISVYDYRRSPSSIEAEKITQKIMDHHDISFASNGIIDEAKLKQIREMNYEELKSILDTKSDFCIYIEDEYGNLILEKGPENLDSDYCK